LKERFIKNKRTLNPTHISLQKGETARDWDNKKNKSNVSI
jgi:hypothetical protein